VSERWMTLARTPGPANPNYGFANWYLNTDRKPLPNAPASAVRFVGNGANIVYIDWEHDLVVVVRWIKDEAALNEFLGRVIGALNDAK
ncbi:MAG TPA: serine hydrolase, partial [Casimicrobiaceae bacterium]|nr:serine hydrolase [Casimicrobiaceae bacterium]